MTSDTAQTQEEPTRLRRAITGPLLFAFIPVSYTHLTLPTKA